MLETRGLKKTTSSKKPPAINRGFFINDWPTNLQ
jgi:hypothetical protein